MDKTLVESFYERWKDRSISLGVRGPQYRNPGQKSGKDMNFLELVEWGSCVLAGRLSYDNKG